MEPMGLPLTGQILFATSIVISSAAFIPWLVSPWEGLTGVSVHAFSLQLDPHEQADGCPAPLFFPQLQAMAVDAIKPRNNTNRPLINMLIFISFLLLINWEQ
jgi:hypothetical protein